MLKSKPNNEFYVNLIKQYNRMKKAVEVKAAILTKGTGVSRRGLERSKYWVVWTAPVRMCMSCVSVSVYTPLSAGITGMSFHMAEMCFHTHPHPTCFL